MPIDFRHFRSLTACVTIIPLTASPKTYYRSISLSIVLLFSFLIIPLFSCKVVDGNSQLLDVHVNLERPLAPCVLSDQRQNLTDCVPFFPLVDGSPLPYASNVYAAAIFSSLAYKHPSELPHAIRSSMRQLHFGCNHITQAYIFEMDHVLVLAVRGTEKNIQDISLDLRLSRYRLPTGAVAHRGFAKEASCFLPSLEKLLADLQNERPRALWLTGHSMGGAMAVMFAHLMSDDARRLLAGVIAFGAPRVFIDLPEEPEFPQFFIQVEGDPVPTVPGYLLLYKDPRHVVHWQSGATCRRLPAPGFLQRTSLAAVPRFWTYPKHGMENNYLACAEQFYFDTIAQLNRYQ